MKNNQRVPKNRSIDLYSVLAIVVTATYIATRLKNSSEERSAMRDRRDKRDYMALCEQINRDKRKEPHRNLNLYASFFGILIFFFVLAAFV